MRYNQAYQARTVEPTIGAPRETDGAGAGWTARGRSACVEAADVDPGLGLEFLGFVLVGFVAQVVDGALGMAYGVVSTTVLLSLGIAPAAASASVHAAEVFTTGASGLAHLYHRNVDRALFVRLVVPGALGAAAGAYLLSVAPSETIRPVVAAYLAVMGCLIVRKAIAPANRSEPVRRLRALGLVGGFLDAMGGGGWGPIVASTLIARGSVPRYVIGSVNLAEFFVTISATATFVVGIGIQYIWIVVGLLIGGVVAAPLAAILVKRMPARVLMALVGVLVVGFSAAMIASSLH